MPSASMDNGIHYILTSVFEYLYILSSWIDLIHIRIYKFVLWMFISLYYKLK